MTLIDKIFFPLFVIIYVCLMFSCTKAATQEPLPQTQFAAAIQAAEITKPKQEAKTNGVKEAAPMDFTAPQYFMTVQIYYYTACRELFEEPDERKECFKTALTCAAKKMADVQWLMNCLKEGVE